MTQNGHIFQINIYIPVNNWRSGLRKTNALLNLIREQYNDELIDKIYLYAKGLNETKY